MARTARDRIRAAPATASIVASDVARAALARTAANLRAAHVDAFVSVEGKGAEPGKVDVYDLRSFEMVGSVGVGQQAGGIIFWKMEPAG